MESPRAVIFDLDGCLVDSEPLSLGCISEILAESGIEGVGVQYLRDRYLGVSIEKISEDMAAERGQGCPPDFAERFEKRLFDRYEDQLERMDGAKDLLDALAADGYALAVATGGSVRRMGKTLAVSQLGEYFGQHTYSADEVEEGKPAPDLVLHAARQLGVAPGACVVVEDSPHGVRGASAAGMRSVGFVGGTHLEGMAQEQSDRLRDAGAEAVYASLAQVGAHIRGA